jgi:hypothetical protein
MSAPMSLTPVHSSRSASPADPTLKACVALQSLGVVAARRVTAARSDERGQSTAEYALVILGAAAVAALLMAWAGQTNRIGRLLDAVLDNVINRFR